MDFGDREHGHLPLRLALPDWTGAENGGRDQSEHR